MQYYDMADPVLRARETEMAKAVDLSLWDLPLVAIDGEIYFRGYVDHRGIVQVIEKKRSGA